MLGLWIRAAVLPLTRKHACRLGLFYMEFTPTVWVAPFLSGWWAHFQWGANWLQTCPLSLLQIPLHCLLLSYRAWKPQVPLPVSIFLGGSCMWMPPLMSNKDQEILKEPVQRPALNPSQALAVRQVLDESCITALTGGAGRGKSETLVAYIIAVLWLQGHLVAQNPDPANLGTIKMGKKLGGPEGDTPPRACVPTPTSSFWQVVVRVK